MTIGFVVSFFDFRNDVRRVIQELLRDHEVVIFYRDDHQQAIERHTIEGCTYRPIRERTGSWPSKFAKGRYELLRKLPASRNNFYLMEAFKAHSVPPGPRRRRRDAVLALMRLLPKNYAYDDFLRDLPYSGKTDLSGIDSFVCFSEIANDELFARLLAEDFPVLTYVYSWDHPCKQTKFSPRCRYLVWNEGIAEDMQELQGIPEAQVHVQGSSQFAYIAEYRERLTQGALPRTFDFDYLYVGCAVGIEKLAWGELAIIEQLARRALEIAPEFKVVVRPYPQLTDWKLYETLRELPNVVFDDGFRQSDLAQAEDAIYEKLEKMDNATAFFHLGTTMGLECCFLDTPSFILDLTEPPGKNPIHLYHFVHQYQNQKYLIDAAPENHVSSAAQLGTVLSNIRQGRTAAYLKLNEAIRRANQLRDFPEYTKELTGHLAAAMMEG